MNDIFQITFSEVEKAIKSGKHRIARKYLAELTKSKKLSANQKGKIVKWYQRLDMTSKALKLLGNEADKNSLAQMSLSELLLQAQLGDILSYLGSKYVAVRIYKNIDELITEKCKDIGKEIPQYWQYKANLYMRSYDYSNYYKILCKMINLYSNKSYQYQLIKISLADSLEGIGEFASALALIKEVLQDSGYDDRILKGICYQARGEYYFRQKEFKKAERAFEMSESFFDKEVQTKDVAYLYKWWGALYLQQKNDQQAKSKLLKSFSILSHQHAQPIAVLEILYWLEKLPNHQLSFKLQVALKASYCFSPYSYLVGKKFKKDNLIPLPPWIQSQYKDSHNNCWLLEKNKITAVIYDKAIKDLKNRKNILDLYSGLVFERREIELLSELKIRCLTVIIAAGGLGINVWALIDFIYRQDFFNYDQGVRRLKQVIKSLRDKLYPIKLEKGHYYYNFSRGSTIILPMDLNSCDRFHFVRAFKEKFIRSDVEDLLKIQPKSAIRMINSWKHLGVVEEKTIKRKVIYSFI